MLMFLNEKVEKCHDHLQTKEIPCVWKLFMLEKCYSDSTASWHV